MNSVRIRYSLLAIFLCAPPSLAAQALPRALPEDVGMSSSRLERLDDALQKYVDEDRLPGGVAVVLRHGQVVYQNAFGLRDREVGDAMQATDRFRIASQSKALVSVAIMMLQEEGSLLISDQVSRYLPAFSNTTVAVADGDDDYEVVEADRTITL